MQRADGLVHTLHARKRLLRTGQKLRSAGAGFVAIERRHGALQRAGDLLRILQNLPACLQLLVLAGMQRSALDLVDLKFQRLDQPELFALAHRKAVDLLPERLHTGVFLAILSKQTPVAREKVEILQMCRLIEKLLRVVLSMDLDELFPEPFQDRDRNGTAVDAADVFSVRIDLALHEQLVRVIRDLILFKPRKARRSGKDRADKGAACAGTDHVAVGAFAENGGNGVDHDGFARTGFAGEHIEAPVKGNIGLLDHRDILNVQNAQHNIRLPRLNV